MDLRYVHSLSELFAIRVCYLRILQGFWLSDTFIVFVGHCFEGCPPPLLCCSLRKHHNDTTIRTMWLSSPWSSWWQQHHFCGGAWIFTKLAEGSLAIAAPVATAMTAASPNSLVVYKTNMSFCIWGQILCLFGGCRCGPEEVSGMTEGIEM